MKYIIAALSGKQIFLKDQNWYDINYIKNNYSNFITLERILCVRGEFGIQIGKPFLLNTYISGLIVSNVLGKKIKVFKTKPKKNYSRLKGYRSRYTRIFISI